MTTAHELTVAADLTYRQVDFWTRAGYLRTTDGDPAPGSGNHREYDEHEVAVAVQMSRLTRAGIPANVARRLAGDLLLDGFAWLTPASGDYLLQPTSTVDLQGEPLPDVVRHIHQTGDAA